MRYIIIGVAIVALAATGVFAWVVLMADDRAPRYSDSEAGFAGTGAQGEHMDENTDSDPTYLPPIMEPLLNGRVRWSVYWQPMTPREERVYGNYERPDGPPRVGLQVGHWQLDDVPEELEGLRASSGARGGGYTEQEAVLAIAEHTKTLLEDAGVVVDLLPATVPVDYIADAFVSIHADGSGNADVSGYKIAGPRRDFSEKADALVDALYASYGEASGLRQDGNITRRMSSYYAFNWRRYDHALHPMTPAAIVETGFMTSAADRAVIVDRPDIAAKGIADGILSFLGITP